MSIVVLVASGRPVSPGSCLQALAKESDIRVIPEPVQDVKSLLPALTQHLPHVVLLDESIFDALDGGTRERLAHLPGVHIVLMCEELDARLLEKVLRCGLHGLLQGDCPAEHCMKAVRAVSQGELWLPRAMLNAAIARLMQSPGTGSSTRSEPRGELTERESEIVDFVRQGLTNKEIARHLGIMEDTVKKHLQSVFTKLGVRRRTLVAMIIGGAVARGRRAGRLSAS